MSIDFGFVRLREINPQDLEQMRIWRNDPDIYRWCRQNNLISVSDQEDWYHSQRKNPTIRMFKLCDQYGDGKIVGVCGLTSIDLINKRAEFSLYVGPEYWRKGYAKHGLLNLCLYGFTSLGLNCIWGESFEGNPAIQMFESIGFKKEGMRRQFYFKEGKFIDAHLFSFLRSDWDSRISSGTDLPTEQNPDRSHVLDAAKYCAPTG